ncbi:TerD family protein [Streptomyces sp. NPDC048603]|uniref:TerD family protein n=1 Tax=Streptomyces sp. NPDC048603 TaxID=3365577 RepID=UPI00370FD765
MTAELVRGQNHPLPRTDVEITVTAGTPVLALAAFGDGAGSLSGPGELAHPGARSLAGLEVPGSAAAGHRFAVDLDAVPAEAERVLVFLALPPGGPGRFGAVAAPHVRVGEPGGSGIAEFTLAGLDSESAVVAVELYRRQGAWKVRAVGQGYAGGLGALLADHGIGAAAAAGLAAQVDASAGVPAAPDPVPVSGVPYTGTPGPAPTGAQAGAPAPAVPPAAEPAAEGPAPVGEGGHGAGGTAGTGTSGTGAGGAATSGTGIDYTHPRRTRTQPPPPPPQAPLAAPGEPPRPVAGDATGWSMDERLYNQVWGMFEDLARAVAAYRSAIDFADSRMDRELDEALSDPRHRLGGSGNDARDAARARREELAEQARAVLDRDLAQLAAELEVVEPALPSAYARWDNPVWHAHRVSAPDADTAMALRLGDLHLPERPDLRIPMLVRLPLQRGLWIDNGRTGSEAAMAMDTDRLRRAALDAAVAHVARVLAVQPGGRLSVHVIDAAGAGAAALEPLVRSGVLATPPAAGAQGVTETLERLTRRVDMVQMAVRGGAAEALPPEVDTDEQLLVVHDFPHGFDDRAVTRLRYLADEGPSVGVHLLMVADRDEASAYGPLLDPLWKSLMRLSPVPDDHLADPWVGHAWTFEPALPPRGSAILDQVLAETARARAGRP